MNEFKDKELLFEVYRILNNSNVWCPAVSDIQSHEITPLWVAGVAYAVFARYIDGLEESQQSEFQEQAFYFFKYLIENGMDHIERKYE
jgi:hypothetical protein